jgi:hypothetical protein
MADRTRDFRNKPDGTAQRRQAIVTDRSPAWLRIETCLGLAAAVALIGLTTLQLIAASPIDDHSRHYVAWLRKLRAVEEICGRRVELNPECWRQHPLPPDPSAIWGR